MDTAVITVGRPFRVRGGWVIDARVHFGASSEPIRLTVTERLASAIIKQACGQQAAKTAGIDDLFEIAGVWDRIIAMGKAIVSNPAVKMAVSMVPYGSTALTIADAGFAVADAANSSVKAQEQLKAQAPHVQKTVAQHKAALKLARDARAKKPAAVRAFKLLGPGARQMVEQARLYEARTDAIRDYRRAKDGDQGALDRIQRVKTLGTKNPFCLAYSEAIENAAIADQGPESDLYAGPEDLPSDYNVRGDAEVGARVRRPRTRRRPVAVALAELADVVNRPAA